jgi:hypothetical protein
MTFLKDVSPGHASVVDRLGPGKPAPSYLPDAPIIQSNHTPCSLTLLQGLLPVPRLRLFILPRFLFQLGLMPGDPAGQFEQARWGEGDAFLVVGGEKAVSVVLALSSRSYGDVLHPFDLTFFFQREGSSSLLIAVT